MKVVWVFKCLVRFLWHILMTCPHFQSLSFNSNPNSNPLSIWKVAHAWVKFMEPYPLVAFMDPKRYGIYSNICPPAKFGCPFTLVDFSHIPFSLLSILLFVASIFLWCKKAYSTRLRNETSAILGARYTSVTSHTKNKWHN